jgi:hypothetical protein
LIPSEAIKKRRAEQIRELARRFLRLVHAARARMVPRAESAFSH